MKHKNESSKKKKSVMKKKKKSSNSGDWLSALVQQATSQENAHGNKDKHLNSNPHYIPSKAERIQKRMEKKQRRLATRGQTDPTHGNTKVDSRLEKGQEHILRRKRQQQQQQRERKQSQTNLQLLSNLMENIIHSHYADGMTRKQLRCLPRYQAPETLSSSIKSHFRERTLSFFLSSSQSSIATNNTKKQQQQHQYIQPRKRDYGGLGLARPSYGISLWDPSFIPKLEQEFGEHIPGFFGKQKTKAMKKQLDGGMLWRRLLDAKKGKEAGVGGSTSKTRDGGENETKEDRLLHQTVDGVRLSDMRAENRVEAMIKAGML